MPGEEVPYKIGGADGFVRRRNEGSGARVPRPPMVPFNDAIQHYLGAVFPTCIVVTQNLAIG